MNNLFVGFSRIFLLGILIFKWLTARRFYKSFGFKGLNPTVFKVYIYACICVCVRVCVCVCLCVCLCIHTARVQIVLQEGTHRCSFTCVSELSFQVKPNSDPILLQWTTTLFPCSLQPSF